MFVYIPATSIRPGDSMLVQGVTPATVTEAFCRVIDRTDLCFIRATLDADGRQIEVVYPAYSGRVRVVLTDRDDPRIGLRTQNETLFTDEDSGPIDWPAHRWPKAVS